MDECFHGEKELNHKVMRGMPSKLSRDRPNSSTLGSLGKGMICEHSNAGRRDRVNIYIYITVSMPVPVVSNIHLNTLNTHHRNITIRQLHLNSVYA
jgi:hypothetical protein